MIPLRRQSKRSNSKLHPHGFVVFLVALGGCLFALHQSVWRHVRVERFVALGSHSLVNAAHKAGVSKTNFSWKNEAVLIPKTKNELGAHEASLPSWMIDYIEWHAEQRKLLSESNYMSFRYLILRCEDGRDFKCGGLSDRLKPLPLLFLEAAQSRRLLFIHWTRPAPLEEFLQPSRGGLDWRIPPWFESKMESEKVLLITTASTLAAGVRRTNRFVAARIQDQHGGSVLYNKIQGTRAYRRVFRSLWKSIFKPSLQVQTALQSQLKKMELIDGQYVAAHLRALYDKSTLDDTYLRAITLNAVNCASQLRQSSETPVYFAADTEDALVYVRHYARTQNLPIVAAHRQEPLHLDKSKSRNPRDYDNIFVDLFLLSQASCIAHGRGGFGRLGVLLSHNASCVFKFVENGTFKTCDWRA